MATIYRNDGVTFRNLAVIHRLREQFRKAVCHEIRQTVADPEEEAGELRYLIEVLSSASWNPWFQS